MGRSLIRWENRADGSAPAAASRRVCTNQRGAPTSATIRKQPRAYARFSRGGSGNTGGSFDSGARGAIRIRTIPTTSRGRMHATTASISGTPARSPHMALNRPRSRGQLDALPVDRREPRVQVRPDLLPRGLAHRGQVGRGRALAAEERGPVV